jgi:uncharacterized protein
MEGTDYRRAIADYIRGNAKPAEKFSHQPRVYHLARQLGAGKVFDDDVLYAAAWLHDIGVFIGHRPEDPAALASWDNVAYAAREVPRLLKRFGFPPEKISVVVDAISTHLPRNTPTSIEGTLLRDADILEQLGAIGILRTVCKVGRDSRYVTFSDAVRTLQKQLEGLPRFLRLPKAQALAQKRVEILRAFLEAAQAEAGSDPL